MAYPPVGFFDPLQGPSFENHRLSPTNPDGRPVRLRGSVSVPIVPAPTGATAAPLSEPRCREASRSGVRVAPVSPSSPRSRAVRANEHSKRHVHGASRASRASRIVTDAGRPQHPLRGACRVDVAIAFDRPECCHRPSPEGHGVMTAPRLIAAYRGPKPANCSWKDEPVWNPFFAAHEADGRCRLSASPWVVSVREEGAR